MRLEIFVAHSFHDEHHIGGLTEFRRRVEAAAEVVSKASPLVAGERVQFDLYFEDRKYGDPLPTEIREQIRRSDICFLDISGRTANILYELGYAHGLKRQLIILEQSAAAALPSDISDLLVGRYSTMEELQTKLGDRLTDLTREIARQHARGIRKLTQRCFWFEPSIAEIHIVCALESELTRFASASSTDYLHVDNFDDRDALFEISTLLARSFPEAKVHRHIAGNHSTDIVESNLVILGGPRNNSMTRDIAALVEARFSYPQDKNSLVLLSPTGQIVLTPKKDSAGVLEKDIGYFGLFPNPFNRNNRIIMCHGLHTFGTLGACIAFGDNNQAIENYISLSRLISIDEIDRFECGLEISIMENRRIAIPKFRSELLLDLT